MEPAIEIQTVPGGTELFVFFGGIASGIGIPPFEFHKASGILNQHRIFVRDLRQCWYQAGVPGMGDDLRSVAHDLETRIREIGVGRVRFVGNSMGGFAALIFSSLLETGGAIAFSPQTFISPILRLRHGDRRWWRRIWRAWVAGLRRERIWDLRGVLASQPPPEGCLVCVSSTCALDCIHAAHISDLPGVHVRTFEEGGHGLVGWLRDTGRLGSIMTGLDDLRKNPL
jgi:pimeloyl-ACP methyl ester carboxylesterase